MNTLITLIAVCSAFTAGIGIAWVVWLAKFRHWEREHLEGLVRKQGARAESAGHHTISIVCRVLEEYMSLVTLIQGRDPMEAETWPALYQHSGVQQGDSYSHGMALKEVGTVTQALQDAKIAHRFQHAYHDDQGGVSSWAVHVRPEDLTNAERIVRSALQGQRDAYERLKNIQTAKKTVLQDDAELPTTRIELDGGAYPRITEGMLAEVYDDVSQGEAKPVIESAVVCAECKQLTPASLIINVVHHSTGAHRLTCWSCWRKDSQSAKMTDNRKRE